MSDTNKFQQLLTMIGDGNTHDPAIRVLTESLIESIDTPGVKNRAWSELSRAAAKDSCWDLSERAALRIDDPHSQSIALMKLASDQLRAGENINSHRVFMEAEHVADQVIDPEEKSWGLYLLVGTLVECNELANAERIAESIENAYDKSSAFNRIGNAYVEAQRTEDALNSLSKAEDVIQNGEALDWAKGEVLCRTAKAMLKLGRTTNSVELLRRAASFVKGVDDVEEFNASSDRASVLREIVYTLELAGEEELASKLRRKEMN